MGDTPTRLRRVMDFSVNGSKRCAMREKKQRDSIKCQSPHAKRRVSRLAHGLRTRHTASPLAQQWIFWLRQVGSRGVEHRQEHQREKDYT